MTVVMTGATFDQGSMPTIRRRTVRFLVGGSAASVCAAAAAVTWLYGIVSLGDGVLTGDDTPVALSIGASLMWHVIAAPLAAGALIVSFWAASTRPASSLINAFRTVTGLFLVTLFAIAVIVRLVSA